MNYNNKKFTAFMNSDNGQVSTDTVFRYYQEGNILTARYEGGEVLTGQIIGVVDTKGNIEMRYQHLTKGGEFMTGKCKSSPKILPNGKLQLHEKWEWTSGDFSTGVSILEEL